MSREVHETPTFYLSWSVLSSGQYTAYETLLQKIHIRSNKGSWQDILMSFNYKFFYSIWYSKFPPSTTLTFSKIPTVSYTPPKFPIHFKIYLFYPFWVWHFIRSYSIFYYFVLRAPRGKPTSSRHIHLSSPSTLILHPDSEIVVPKLVSHLGHPLYTWTMYLRWNVLTPSTNSSETFRQQET